MIETFRRGSLALKLSWAAGTLLITILSLLPKALMIPEPPLSDKIAHFLAYGAVTFIGVRAASTARRRLQLGIAMLALGITLELVQQIVPGRAPEFYDAAANALGVFAGIVLDRFIGAGDKGPAE